MKTLTLIFKPILALFILIMLGGHVMAKDFYEVKDPIKVLEVTKGLEDLRSPHQNRLYSKKSPLQTVLYAKQVHNTIILTINIRNDNDFEWFLEKKNDGFILIFNQEGESVGRYPREVGNPPGLNVSMPPPVDGDYWLLEPREAMNIKVEMPAQEFYNRWQQKNIYLLYNSGGNLPPTLNRLQDQIDPEVSYRVINRSNRVRIRCSRYDYERKQYICDIEVLPYGKLN